MTTCTCGATAEIHETAGDRHLCIACACELMTRPLWAIHHAEREFARLTGDPVLGYVRASSKDEAETAAGHLGQGAGVWAVEVQPVKVGGY